MFLSKPGAMTTLLIVKQSTTLIYDFTQRVALCWIMYIISLFDTIHIVMAQCVNKYRRETEKKVRVTSARFETTSLRHLLLLFYWLIIDGVDSIIFKSREVSQCYKAPKFQILPAIVRQTTVQSSNLQGQPRSHLIKVRFQKCTSDLSSRVRSQIVVHLERMDAINSS